MGEIPSRSGISNLPERSRTTLAYHEPTRTLIAHTESRFESLPRNRLFFRTATETRFQPVMTFPDAISINSSSLDASRSSLYFLTQEWEILPDTATVAGNWDALYRFHLGEHRAERLTWRGDLRAPFGIDRTWLTALLSVSDEGHSVFCVAGLDKGCAVEYWMCELELAGMRLKPVSRLEIDVIV